MGITAIIIMDRFLVLQYYINVHVLTVIKKISDI